MTTKDRLNTAQWVLDKNLAWITAADVKGAFLVTLNTAMLGSLASAFSGAEIKFSYAVVITIAAACLSIVAIFCAAMSFKPRLQGPKKSLLFFGAIVKLPQADYVEQITKVTDEELLLDWSQQIYRNAEIAASKHGWIQKGMLYSFFAALPWISALICLVEL